MCIRDSTNPFYSSFSLEHQQLQSKSGSMTYSRIMYREQKFTNKVLKLRFGTERPNVDAPVKRSMGSVARLLRCSNYRVEKALAHHFDPQSTKKRCMTDE